MHNILKTVHVFVPVFLNPVTMLIFQINRIISSEKWVNALVTFFFFLKMPKIWVGWTTANREKKEDGLTLKYRLGAIELGNDLFKNLVTGYISQHCSELSCDIERISFIR